MPVAVITDVHSNLPALEAVLADAERRGAEEIWCLGDVLGYGAQPDECARLVRERCDACLVGNHDLAVLGALDVESFSEAAAIAVEWTRGEIGEPELEHLRTLSPSGSRSGVGLFHASPRDPVWEYVLSVEQAQACLEVQPESVALIGHSHVALFFGRSGGVVQGEQAAAGTRLDVSAGRWLLNPGSVGQPRDGDPRAAWLELDLEAGAAVYRRVEYDVEAAASAIAAAGLPKRLGDRLFVGQ